METKNEIKSEELVIEPTDISLMKTRDDLQVGVANILHNYEETRERPQGVRRLDDVWNQVLKVNDNNEKVLDLMNQCYVLFQQSHDKYFAELAEDEEYVEQLAKDAEASAAKGEEGFDKKLKHAQKEKIRIERKVAAAQKNLRAFMDSAVKMAHEYRQCRTQQQYYFHVSQFQQFFALLIAVLHQEITQANVLEKVSKKLTDASLKLFPVEVQQNDR